MIPKPRILTFPVKSHPPARGLVGYWLMNEDSGDIVNDLSGNGNTGTLSGVDWVGSGLYFGGSNDKVTIPSNPIYDFTDDFTVIAGVKPDAADAGRSFVTRYDDVSTDGFRLGQTTAGDGRYQFNVLIGGDSDNVRSALPPSTTKFEQIVGVRQPGGALRMYRNGVLEADSGNQAGAIVSTGDLLFGIRHDAATDYLGYLDYVMIWNHALSAFEIAFLYLHPFCMFERDPIELWSAATLGAAPPVGMAGAMTTNSGYWGY